MGTNTLTDIAGGTVQPSDINNVHTALKEDFVPRASDGSATNEAGSLGTPAIQWLAVRAKQFYVDGEELGQTVDVIKRNQVISGKTRSTSNQPAYLEPNGAAASAVVDCTTPDLVINIDGEDFTLTADISLTSLTTAPATNNTCTVNDSEAADQASTRTWGEFLAEKESITVASMGSEITSLVGTWQAFKINDGATDEYFYAYISSTTLLSKIFRGYYYNSSIAPVNRIKFTNSDTITLLKAGYVFVTSAGAATVIYTNPTWSATQPGSPTTGDRWYDLTEEKWKSYNGSIFVDAEECYLGMVIMDSSNCIGAKCVDFASKPNRENTLFLEVDSVTTMKAEYPNATVNVLGNWFHFKFNMPEWDITSDLAASADLYDATEQASRRYFLYVSDEGETIISDIEPYYRFEYFGFYHPHNPWRAVGYVYNDSGSDFDYSSDFPGDAFDWSNDYWELPKDASQSITVGTPGVYTDITLGSTVSSENGDAVTFSGNNIIFQKRGTYEIRFRVDNTSGSAGSGAYLAVRLYNVTDSATIATLGTASAPGNSSSNLNGSLLPGTFVIKDLDANYRLQGESTTATSTISNMTVTLVRKPGLYIGKE